MKLLFFILLSLLSLDIQAQVIFWGSPFNNCTNTAEGVLSFSNSVNYGKAMSSPGGTGGAQFTSTSEQFGQGARAINGNASHAFGNSSIASGISSIAMGYLAAATNTQAIAIGSPATASGQNAVSIGGGAVADNDTTVAVNGFAHGNGSTAVGYGATVASGHTASTAIGYGATTTAANQIMLGRSSETVVATTVNTTTLIATNLLTTLTNAAAVGTDGDGSLKAVTSFSGKTLPTLAYWGTAFTNTLALDGGVYYINIGPQNANSNVCVNAVSTNGVNTVESWARLRIVNTNASADAVFYITVGSAGGPASSTTANTNGITCTHLKTVTVLVEATPGVSTNWWNMISQ